MTLMARRTSSPVASPRTRAGMSAGLPAPTRTTSTPASRAPKQAAGRGRSILCRKLTPTSPVMALLGQEDLDEVGGDGELDQFLTGGHGVPRHRAVRHSRRDPALDEVGGEDPLGDAGHREGGQRAPDVPTGVAVLEPAGADDVERRARDHPELADRGDGARQRPPGDGHPHPALDDPGRRPTPPRVPGHRRDLGRRCGGGQGRGGHGGRLSDDVVTSSLRRGRRGR